MPDELVNNNQQNISVSGTKWDQICHDKYIRHILMEPYIHCHNAAEVSCREILRIYYKRRVHKGVPKLLFPYLVNWFCDTRNATALDIPELDGKTPRDRLIGKTYYISHLIIHEFYDPVK